MRDEAVERAVQAVIDHLEAPRRKRDAIRALHREEGMSQTDISLALWDGLKARGVPVDRIKGSGISPDRVKQLLKETP